MAFEFFHILGPKESRRHAAKSLSPGTNKRACKIHENAGHVANAGENIQHLDQVTKSLRVLKTMQSDKCEVHKSQHFLKCNPPPHLKQSVPTSHRMGTELIRLLVQGCERRMRRTQRHPCNHSSTEPLALHRESKINKMWSECLKQAGQEPLEFPQAHIHRYPSSSMIHQEVVQFFVFTSGRHFSWHWHPKP